VRVPDAGVDSAMGDDDRQTSMQFCQECNNLMYPREVYDPDTPQDSRLVYVCKAPNCVVSSREKTECMEADSTMVWKHVLQHSLKMDDRVTAEIIQDPTLPRTNGVTCPGV
jgi:DNA-directed RNA polymerase subunit M/transcription elongation factor TFIIS